MSKKFLRKRTYIKFTGKYTDLQDMGYKFQKLFARNYMQWCKHVDPEGYGHCIRVWKKGGGDVEFDDLYDRSHLVLEAIRTNNMVKTEFMGSTWYAFAINKKNDTITPWDSKIHSDYAMLINKKLVNEKMDQICSDEEYKQALKEYYDTWREYCINPEFVAIIKELDSNMEIVRIPNEEISNQ